MKTKDVVCLDCNTRQTLVISINNTNVCKSCGSRNLWRTDIAPEIKKIMVAHEKEKNANQF